MKRPVTIGLTIAGLVAGVVLVLSYWHSSHSQNQVAKPWAVYAWEIGKQYRYSMDWQQDGSFQLESLTPQGSQADSKTQMPFHSEIKGSLSLIPLEKLEGKTKLAILMEPSDVKFIFGKQQTAVEKQLYQILREPHAIVLRDDGTVEGFHFSTKSIPISRNIIRQLSAELFPRLQDGESVEEGMNGKTHTRLSHECGKGFCKLQRSFESFEMRMKGSEAKIDGSFVYQFDAEPLVIRSVQGSKQLKLTRDNQVMSADNLNLRLDFLTSEKVSAQQISDWNQGLSSFASSINGQEEYAAAELEQMRNRIKDTTYEAELAKFRGLPSTIDITDMLDLYKNLMAFLKLYPEKVNEFAELLREFPVKDRRFDIVGVVLARNGTVPAQQEILKAMDEMWADPEAVRLLSMSLALMDKPDDSIVTAMIDKYDGTEKDESRSILLGNLAGAGFHSQNNEIKNKIRERVVNAIQSSGSDSEKSDAFLALGNLGHENAIDFVQTYIRSERPQDRIWAAQGVRRVGGGRADEATQILVDLSEADKDLQVRRAASSVMRGREFNEQQLDVLAAQLYKERDITVVMNILDSLADRSLNREKVREVLVNYFKECGTPSVCKKVENMLLSK